MTSPDPAPVLVLCRDLMFASKLSAAARRLGVPLQILREPAALQGNAGAQLFVDLGQPAALEAAVSWKSRTAKAVLGFVSHVDVEMIARARSAGIKVLTRGAFVQRIDGLLTQPEADDGGETAE